MHDDRKRMEEGVIYDPGVSEIMDEQSALLDNLYEFNHTRPSEMDKRNALLKKMFGKIGKDCYIEPPFHANWAGKHVFFGDRVYANFGLTLVDDGNIYVGDRTMFGPNVVVATANHPIEKTTRFLQLQYNKDVHIGSNVWIGAGVVIVPGVTIGDDSVIGAGSIVTKDIPAGVVAVGNPCRVIREIGERDREYFYKDEKIDWDVMEEYISAAKEASTEKAGETPAEKPVDIKPTETKTEEPDSVMNTIVLEDYEHEGDVSSYFTDEEISGGVYAYTDGSFNEPDNTYGYGVVMTAGGKLYELMGRGDDPVLAKSRNIPGETLGVIAAIDMAKKLGFKSMTIYHDYIGMGCWARGEWKADKPVARQFKEYMSGCGVKVNFVHVKGHSGKAGNERADKLASRAAGIS